MKKNGSRLANVMMLGLLLLGTFVPSVSALAETIESSVATSTSEVIKQKDLEPLTDSTEETKTTESSKKATSATTSEQVPSDIATSVPLAKETKTLTILGTSDVHGNIWDWSYEDDAPADLGQRLRASHPQRTR